MFLRTYEHTSLPQDSNLLFICFKWFYDWRHTLYTT